MKLQGGVHPAFTTNNVTLAGRTLPYGGKSDRTLPQ